MLSVSWIDDGWNTCDSSMWSVGDRYRERFNIFHKATVPVLALN